MTNRQPAAQGLAQMLASDPEIATRLRAWMDANPQEMPHRKQRKLLRDLDAAEALLRAEREAVVSAEPVADVAVPAGPPSPAILIGAVADKSPIETAARSDEKEDRDCPAEAGSVEAGTEAKEDLKPRHCQAWVQPCAVLAWLELASRFAAMVVLGAAVALVLIAEVVAFVVERNRRVSECDGSSGGVVTQSSPMHCYAWALWGWRNVWWLVLVARRFAFARGPLASNPAVDVILRVGPGGVFPVAE